MSADFQSGQDDAYSRRINELRAIDAAVQSGQLTQDQAQQQIMQSGIAERTETATMEGRPSIVTNARTGVTLQRATGDYYFRNQDGSLTTIHGTDSAALSYAAKNPMAQQVSVSQSSEPYSYAANPKLTTTQNAIDKLVKEYGVSPTDAGTVLAQKTPQQIRDFVYKELPTEQVQEFVNIKQGFYSPAENNLTPRESGLEWAKQVSMPETGMSVEQAVRAGNLSAQYARQSFNRSSIYPEPMPEWASGATEAVPPELVTLPVFAGSGAVGLLKIGAAFALGNVAEKGVTKYTGNPELGAVAGFTTLLLAPIAAERIASKVSKTTLRQIDITETGKTNILQKTFPEIEQQISQESFSGNAILTYSKKNILGEKEFTKTIPILGETKSISQIIEKNPLVSQTVAIQKGSIGNKAFETKTATIEQAFQRITPLSVEELKGLEDAGSIGIKYAGGGGKIVLGKEVPFIAKQAVPKYAVEISGEDSSKLVKFQDSFPERNLYVEKGQVGSFSFGQQKTVFSGKYSVSTDIEGSVLSGVGSKIVGTSESIVTGKVFPVVKNVVLEEQGISVKVKPSKTSFAIEDLSSSFKTIKKEPISGMDISTGENLSQSAVKANESLVLKERTKLEGINIFKSSPLGAKQARGIAIASEIASKEFVATKTENALQKTGTIALMTEFSKSSSIEREFATTRAEGASPFSRLSPKRKQVIVFEEETNYSVIPAQSTKEKIIPAFGISFKQETMPRTVFSLGTKQEMELKQESTLLPKVFLKNIVSETALQKTLSSTATRTVSKQLVESRSALKQQSSTIARQASLTKTVARTIAITRPVVVPKIKQPFLPIILPKSSGKLKVKINDFFGTGFDVFVKRKGKLSKVSHAPLTRRAAFALGQRVTDVTAARSFEVLPSLQEGTPIELNLSSFSPERYYISKHTGLVVEKSKFAISTGGEKMEITQKGIAANRLPLWAKAGNKLRGF